MCNSAIMLDLSIDFLQDRYSPEPLEHEFAVVETISLANDGVSSPFQAITPDVRTDFSFFVSHASGVFYISLESWIRKLENELYDPRSGGADFRLQRLLESANTVAERCIRRNARETKRDVTACVVIEDATIGYLVLTTFDNEPQAVILDAPEDGLPTDEQLEEYMAWKTPASEKREPWQPPKELWETLDLHGTLQAARRSKAFWNDEIKLSPANLEVLMTAHRLLSEHTERLQAQVSDLFNRCQRLQDEYRDQIIRATRTMEKVDAVTGEDEARNGSDLYGDGKVNDRIHKVQDKQKAQAERYLALRRRMASINTTQLSDKEVLFVEELQTMEASVDKNERRLTDDMDGSEVPVWERMNKVREMKDTLSKEVAEGEAKAGGEQRLGSSMKVPSHSRKHEHDQIQAMLQHQTDLLEATIGRLQNLGIAVPLVSDGSR